MRIHLFGECSRRTLLECALSLSLSGISSPAISLCRLRMFLAAAIRTPKLFSSSNELRDSLEKVPQSLLSESHSSRRASSFLGCISASRNGSHCFASAYCLSLTALLSICRWFDCVCNASFSPWLSGKRSWLCALSFRRSICCLSHKGGGEDGK